MLVRTLALLGLAAWFAGLSVACSSAWDAEWHDTPLAVGEYRFSPDYNVTERKFEPTTASANALVVRGGYSRVAVDLVVSTPDGDVTVSQAATLLDLFAPIDTEAEAASLVKATVGGFVVYDGRTATKGDNFLVRTRDVLANCTERAGYYAVIYEVTRDGLVGRIAEEEPRVTSEARICFD